MSWDDILYISLLLLSIPYGHLVKISGSRARKQAMCLGGGLTVALAIVGIRGLWHSFVIVIGNVAIIWSFGHRHCRLPSFLFVFGYLFVFRTFTWYGFEKPPPQCNAIQLLATLKMVGLAFEIHDSGKTSTPLCPSVYDIFSYAYCYCGQLTGPHYTFKTFTDMLDSDGTKVATLRPALDRLKAFAMLALPYVLLNTYFPISHMETKAFLEHPWGVGYQLAYLVPTFTWFRWRFYIGWALAETMCVTLALGAYPHDSMPRPGNGPTKAVDNESYDPKAAALEHGGYSHSFDTIDNIDLLKVEFAPTMKACMKAWNKTVQWWMAVCVHKQIPFKSFRMVIVLLVSAFWHGVHPGYYLTFLSVPLVVVAETRMIRALTPYLTSPLHKQILDWLSWFCLFRSFEYLGVGFMLLRLSAVWTVWTRMYFIGHWCILAFILIPFVIPKRGKPSHNETESKTQ